MTEFLPEFGKPRMILLFGFVFLVASAFLPWVTRAFVGGPPSNGDWIVTGTESYSDQTIVLDGNLIVENGGNLTFHRVILELDCHSDGEYNISVNSGGRFYVLEGSVITSHTPSNGYQFSVQPNSTFRMSDGELHYSGWDENVGLDIRSDDAVVENCLISNNRHGICVSSDGADIRDNNITENFEGVRVFSRAHIHNNHISKNEYGVHIGGPCSPSIYDNTIEYNSDIAIGITNATPTIMNNTITNNGRAGVGLSSSNAVILKNTITSNLGGGVACWGQDESTISENVIALNYPCGVGCEGSSSVIQSNNISQNSGQGIWCSSSHAIIQNNTIALSAYEGIVLWDSNDLIQNNTISSSYRCGIEAHNSSATIRDNNITGHFARPDWGWGSGILCDNSAGTIEGNSLTYNDNGVLCYNHSNPSVTGNSMKNNGNVGVLCLNSSNPTIRGNNILQNNVTGISVFSDCSPFIEGNNIMSNLQSGIMFRLNCTGTIRGNVIVQNGKGIELYEYCSPIIQGNRLTDNHYEGISSATKSNPEIHNNDIYSNTDYGLVNFDTSITINARKNYWGSPTGPVLSPPDATDPEEISGNILYDLWLTEPVLVVEISNPLPNETVSATVTVSANVRASENVQRVEFYVDGLRYNDFDAPYEWSWDTTHYAETYQTIMILAYDVFGLEAKVSRTVFVDNTSPTVLFEEPQSGITYQGIMAISVNATDNREVSSVRVKADDSAWLIMTFDSSSSLWEYDFNTTTLSDGQHTLMGLALDRAGNPATTSMIVLTDNAPPLLTIQHPQSGVTVGLTLTVIVQANDTSGISRVEFYLANTLVSTLTTVPYQWAWDTTKYPNGVYTLRVEAYDMIGNVNSRDLTVTVNNVEVPWWQANLLTIVQVAIGLGGLTVAIVTYWSRTRDKRKKTTKKKETATDLPAQENSNHEEGD
jgi:parallel beta-helix repeat protein